MSIPSPESSSSANHPQQTPFIRWATLLYPFGSAQSRSPEEITFANNMFIVLVGWAIFAVVVIADVYALVSLGLLITTALRPLTHPLAGVIGPGQGLNVDYPFTASCQHVAYLSVPIRNADNPPMWHINAVTDGQPYQCRVHGPRFSHNNN